MAGHEYIALARELGYGASGLDGSWRAMEGGPLPAGLPESAAGWPEPGPTPTERRE